MTRVRTPLSEAFRRVTESVLNSVHTAECGIVESFSSSTQTATLRLANRRVVPAAEEENEDVLEELPLLQNVPIVYPRGGGNSLYFPLSTGDLVLVVFLEQDRTGWRSGGDESEPITNDRHSLSGAVAVPGLFASADPLSSASGTMRLSDGTNTLEFTSSQGIHVGGSEPLANGDNVTAHLQAIEAALTSIAGMGANTYSFSTVNASSPVPTTVTKGT